MFFGFISDTFCNNLNRCVINRTLTRTFKKSKINICNLFISALSLILALLRYYLSYPKDKRLEKSPRHGIFCFSTKSNPGSVGNTMWYFPDDGKIEE